MPDLSPNPNGPAAAAPLAEACRPSSTAAPNASWSWLTDELMNLGHEVTVFASGDSTNSAKLHADLALGATPSARHCAGTIAKPAV
jgi:hypothetical protein